ncbi:proline-specific peptidase [Desulfarculus baarsii DSM 2075]|uniref:Proline-specific peptidase n=1 Tax=Desulfarculus baarsii (strain ATCC 33931 / DSM 2075 / LMG 7858 / VKM B-1802 / 2st14) TaxID=644282 RepID=E1QD85_DESB2|nr:proline iminopeptidase-family hydrolase [Desulfarculus baarsii]ADK83404.1 proline-specific peptidase [Desulfarculus baarsii DSM 2075]
MKPGAWLMTALIAFALAGQALAAGGGKPVEGFVDTRDGRVFYRIHGQGKPGLPLLVVHGGPGANMQYLRPLAALADQRPVIFYDQLGGGDSDRPDDPALWNTARFVDELDQVRRALGLRRLFIVGQSWGAMLATQYVLSHGQEGVAGLILSGPLLSAPRWIADQRLLLAQTPPAIRQAVEKAEAAQSYDSPEYQRAMDVYYRRHLCRLDPWPDFLQESFARLALPVYLAMWGPSEFTCLGSLKEQDLSPRLGELLMPVLYVCGRFDEARPETVGWFAAQTPQGRLVVIEGASHSHHAERPEQFNQALRDFMAEVEASHRPLK